MQLNRLWRNAETEHVGACCMEGNFSATDSTRSKRVSGEQSLCRAGIVRSSCDLLCRAGIVRSSCDHTQVYTTKRYNYTQQNKLLRTDLCTEHVWRWRRRVVAEKKQYVNTTKKFLVLTWTLIAERYHQSISRQCQVKRSWNCVAALCVLSLILLQMVNHDLF